MNVEIHTDSLVRHLKHERPTTVFFETRDPGAATWNETMNAVPEDWGLPPLNSWTIRVPDGWLARFHGTWPKRRRGAPDPILAWCELARERLDAAGFRGTLRAPQPLRLKGLRQVEQVLATVELAWKLDLDSLRDGEQFWLVGEAATSAMIRQICESHDVSGGAVLAVAGGPNGDTPALPDDLESDVRHLLQTLQAGSVGSYFGDDPLRTRFGAFKRPGCSEFVDTYFADTPRTDVDYQPTLRWCRELLSGSTRHVNHAAVYSPTNRLGRGSSRGPGAPGEPDPIFHSASALGRDFWMLEHWLPDVTPIQIVTAHHLDRLGGRLAGWSVGELGDDRYLLEADDALAWFTDPSSERYEIAYREFEPAILKRADARSIRLAQYELWGL